MTVFDAVVGNPPYQENIVGNGFTPAIYHYFMETAQCVGHHVSLIYPARWTLGGKSPGTNDFKDAEIASRHYVKFVLPEKRVFENAEIRGGVNYFLWSAGHCGDTEYFYGDESVSLRSTLLDGFSLFVRESRFLEICEKVDTRSALVPRHNNFYGTAVKTGWRIREFAESIADDVRADDAVDGGGTGDVLTIYYSGRGGGVESARIPGHATKRETDDFKVFVSSHAHSGSSVLSRVSRIFIGSPGEICSVSFNVFAGLTAGEAENLVKYLKTDFATFLFGIPTRSQHSFAESYALIPAVDLSSGEIVDKPGVYVDFSGNSDDIDDRLAEVYELSDDDRRVMRESIRPWRGKNSLSKDGFF